VVEPLAERRSDTWIVFQSQRSGWDLARFWQGDIDAAYEYELAASGISLSQPGPTLGGITVSSAPRYQKYSPDKSGGARGFATPDKKIAIYSHFCGPWLLRRCRNISSPDQSLSRPDIAREYPLVLTNAKFTTYIHSQLRGLASLRKVSPHPSSDIHLRDAQRYGIVDKSWMRIESPRGAIRAKARLGCHLRRVSCCQHGWWQEYKNSSCPVTIPIARTRPTEPAHRQRDRRSDQRLTCRIARLPGFTRSLKLSETRRVHAPIPYVDPETIAMQIRGYLEKARRKARRDREPSDPGQ
jgi:anaerobic selenocysteine-containing dehydrogenase